MDEPKNKLSNKNLQLLLIQYLGYSEYKFDDVWKIYVDAMCNDPEYEKYKAIQKESLRKRLITWSGTIGSWLIKIGSGKGVRYQKREPVKCELTKLGQKVKNRIMRMGSGYWS